MSPKGKSKRKKQFFKSSSILLNKYVLSLLVFVIWISFLDGHNLITQHKLKNTIEKLEIQKKEYVSLIAEAKINRQELEENKERYAREKYYMHKENENVFIILNEK